MTIKTMFAKYKGTCARTGAPIRPGDQIQYDTATRQAWITDEDEFRHAEPEPEEVYLARARGAYVSHLWNNGGREYFQNKRGRCIDSPCCGCCNI
jgi:hypothetical protein